MAKVIPQWPRGRVALMLLNQWLQQEPGLPGPPPPSTSSSTSESGEWWDDDDDAEGGAAGGVGGGDGGGGECMEGDNAHVNSVYTTVCVCVVFYLLHVEYVLYGIDVHCVSATLMATVETFRSSFFFFRYSIG